MLVSFLFHVASGQRRPLGAWGTSASRGLRMVAAKRCGKDSGSPFARGLYTRVDGGLSVRFLLRWADRLLRAIPEHGFRDLLRRRALVVGG